MDTTDSDRCPTRSRRDVLRAIGSFAVVAPLAAGALSAVACAAKEPAKSTGAAAPAMGAAAPVALKNEPAGPFFLYLETLTADRPSVYGYLAPVGCQPSGSFARGERMVFRFMVLDVSTGKYVTPEEAESVKVRLPFAGDMAADYKQRGEGRVADAPWTWDYCWDVPLDYPLGTLDYAVRIALKGGQSGEWKPPALVDPKRGIDTRPQIREQNT